MRRLSVLVALATSVLSGQQEPVQVDRWELTEHKSNWPAIRVPEATGLEAVNVEVQVDTLGRVTSATVVPPLMLVPPGMKPKPVPPSPFAERAIAEILSRTYIPFLQDGKPTPAIFQDLVIFLPPERPPSVHRAFPDIHDWNTLRIGLKRSGCFGDCASYELEVRGDGMVRYTGRSAVAVTGEHETSISREDLGTLLNLFRKADFFSLDSKYSGPWSDGQTNTISLAFDGREMSVVDYSGAEAGMPEAAEQLVGAIDRYGGANRWVRGDENTLAALRRENFNFRSREAGSVLAAVALNGDLKAVQDLIAAGAPLDVGMKTFMVSSLPLDGAVKNNNIEVLRFLIKVGASKNDPAAKQAALKLAVQLDRKEAIALLREYIAE
jgi:hypothetical protein